MALTYTPAPDLGTSCPDFSLPSVEGRSYSLADFASRPVVVVMFICNHCPYVKAIEDRLIQLGHAWSNKGVQFLAICSNDPAEYPEDSFAELKARWQTKKYPFPYLHDESQSVAKSFGAVCTPDFFVFDQDRKLTYRGRLDDSWKDASRVHRQELARAIEATRAGQKVDQPQVPSMGCSIKWL